MPSRSTKRRKVNGNQSGEDLDDDSDFDDASSFASDSSSKENIPTQLNHVDSNTNGVANGTPKEKTQDQKFQALQLRAIIKENHGKEINQLQFNFADPKYKNVLATVGECQANVYDNEHFGNHLDLMLHFVNRETPFTKKNVKSLQVKTCVWMKYSGTSDEYLDDAYLVIGGEDQLIHVISIKRTKVVTILRGHTDTVTDLARHPTHHSLLLSASIPDGTVRLWNIHAKKPNTNCLQVRVDFTKCNKQVWHTTATVVSFFPTKDNSVQFLTGGNGGAIRLWKADDAVLRDDMEEDTSSQTEKQLPKVVSEKEINHDHTIFKVLKSEKKSHNVTIDSIYVIDETKIVTKSADGKVLFWDPSQPDVVHSEIRIPNTRGLSCRMDVSPDHKYLVSGNGEGAIFVCKLETGTTICKLHHRRSRTPVRACAFTHDMNSILFVAGDSNLWRFDYRDEASTVNPNLNNYSDK